MEHSKKADDYNKSSPARQGGHLRELRLRHAAYYISLLDTADRQFTAGGDGMQAALTCFDKERGQLDTVRA